MSQQAPIQVLHREEERVLGIAYDRAVPAIPKLVKKATGAEVQELGDGYWVATLTEPNGIKRELTIRLGKQGPDTRFSLRAETVSQGAAYLAFVIVFGILTFGLGFLLLLGMIQKRAREEQRQRDLLIHKTFRAIEDAVADQGLSPGYRIAAGEGAAEPAGEPEAEDETAALGASDPAVRRSTRP